MIDRQKGTRTAIVAAAGLFAGLAGSHPGMAQAGPPEGGVVCHDFARNGYGDWTVVRPTTFSARGVTLNLAPGRTFMPSQMVRGIEPTEVLDRNCGNE